MREHPIVDDQGNEATPNTTGEIVIKGEPGKTLFKEYYNNPEATAKALDSHGWLYTGDSGYMDEDGYFYFVDRNVNLIKRSGENISSSEIENALVCHPKIIEAAVIGIPDEMYDEVVNAFVILKEGEILSTEEILEFCSTHMAAFKVPAHVEFRTEFPRTCTGKVQKNVLKEEVLSRSEYQQVENYLINRNHTAEIRVDTVLN